MGRGELRRRWEDIFGNGVEYAGILPKEADVEDFLWITEA